MELLKEKDLVEHVFGVKKNGIEIDFDDMLRAVTMKKMVP